MHHRRLVPLLLLSIALSAGPPTADAETVARFASLVFRETPYAPFRGVGPVSDQQAATRNHFVFRHDDRGRLVDLSFRLGDALRPVNHAANHYFRAPRVTIVHADRRETHRFFDLHGHPTVVDGRVGEARYALDTAGRRIALSYHGTGGEAVENAWGIHRYHWRHEPDGSVVEHRFDRSGATVDMRPHLPFRAVRFRYRPNGLLEVMQNLDRAGALRASESGVAQDRLTYRDDGAVLGWQVLDTRGRPRRGNHPNVAQGVIDADARGFERGIHYLDEAGKPMHNAWGWGRGATTYDRFGNWSRRAFLDAAGRPMLVPELGYHAYTFTWDRRGRRLLTRWYEDLDGGRVAHARRGFAGIAYAYDRSDDPVRIDFLDAAGRSVARTDTGVATIVRRYDARNRLREERFLDADGRTTDDRVRGYARTVHRYDPAGWPLPVERWTAEGHRLPPD